DANLSEADDSQALNISDLSVISNYGPFKVPALPGAPTSKKRKVGNVKKASCRSKQFICTYCLKPYVAETTMRKHMWVHTMLVAASRFPDEKEIMLKANEISMKALTEVSNCPSYGNRGQVFRELMGAVSCSDNFIIFSTLILQELSLDERMENILSDNNFFERCFCTLNLSNFDVDNQSQFFLEFCIALVSELFQFISSTFRTTVVRRAVRPMPVLDHEDKQVIYYIGGSIMKGYLRMAFRYKSNSKWKEIYGVLKSQVLSDSAIGDIDAEWTRQLDRGRLLLTNIVYQNERMDGSVDYDLIIKIVSNSQTSQLWDSVILDSLSHDKSKGFMNDVVCAFCKACGRGIARRRLNALRDKPVISMPTRHAVASRKK
ncbi:Zinc finger and BTB domain-containing protein 2, partial [Frankliniella fusca]